VNTNNCVSICGHRELFQFVERLSKNRQTDRYSRYHELCVWKAQVNSFFQILWNSFHSAVHVVYSSLSATRD